MGEYIFECNNLTKKFGTKAALSDLSLSIGRGKIIGLLGPNGSGKTTLIKTANSLLPPTCGEILIDGLKPGYETKAKISYLPDRNYFNDKMRVSELVKMFEDFYKDFDASKAYRMIENLMEIQIINLKPYRKETRKRYS